MPESGRSRDTGECGGSLSTHTGGTDTLLFMTSGTSGKVLTHQYNATSLPPVEALAFAVLPVTSPDTVLPPEIFPMRGLRHFGTAQMRTGIRVVPWFESGRVFGEGCSDGPTRSNFYDLPFSAGYFNNYAGVVFPPLPFADGHGFHAGIGFNGQTHSNEVSRVFFFPVEKGGNYTQVNVALLIGGSAYLRSEKNAERNRYFVLINRVQEVSNYVDNRLRNHVYIRSLSTIIESISSTSGISS